jgi:hypothetical protein
LFCQRPVSDIEASLRGQVIAAPDAITRRAEGPTWHDAASSDREPANQGSRDGPSAIDRHVACGGSFNSLLKPSTDIDVARKRKCASQWLGQAFVAGEEAVPAAERRGLAPGQAPRRQAAPGPAGGTSGEAGRFHEIRWRPLAAC